MKNIFPEHYPYKNDALSSIWKDAIVVPDTNVLLHLIRYRKQDADILFSIFAKYKRSLWLPYQIAEEYHQHKNRIIVEIETAYDRYISAVEKTKKAATDEFRKSLTNQGRHPLLDVSEEVEQIETLLNKEIQRIQNKQNNHPSKKEIQDRCDSIAELFRDQVGPRLSSQDSKEFQDKYHERLKAKQPPGFQDYDGDNIPGDAIIWEEMNEFACDQKRPIIFISDDVKDDWWERHHGQKIGPRPELKREFRVRTGRDFLIYTFENFLKIAGSDINDTTKRRSLDRVKRMSEERQKEQELRIRKLGEKQERINRIEPRIKRYERRALELRSMLSDVARRMDTCDSLKERSNFESEYNSLNAKLHELNSYLAQLHHERDVLMQALRGDVNFDDKEGLSWDEFSTEFMRDVSSYDHTDW